MVRVLNCRKGRSQRGKRNQEVNLRILRPVPAGKRGLIAVLAAAVAAGTSLSVAVPLARSSGEQPRGATIVEAEPSGL
jgi:hypothetical protein